MQISILAALTWPGRVIGKGGALPWNLPADLRRFKALTSGHAVLMGRRTWDSLPQAFRPLPERYNLVMSRQTLFEPRGADKVRSVEEAAEKARNWFDRREDAGERIPSDPRLWVIGGAEIYSLALPLVERMALTFVHYPFEGDARFPAFDLAEWRVERVGFCREVGPPAFDYEFVDLSRP